MNNREICLDGDWRFRQAGKGELKVRSWLPATVPGTVHTDLLANRKVADPFDRMNELDQKWVEYADWSYRRSFSVAKSFLSTAAAVWLDCEGLDTFATVRINGKRIAQTDNMFHGWRFDVKRFLRVGQNDIQIDFASAPRVAEALAKKSPVEYKVVFYNPRVFIRKAQYSSGWDWGPRFMTSGIWRSIRLTAVDVAELRSIYVVTKSLTDKQAKLDIEMEIDAHAGSAAQLELTLTCRSTGEVVRKTVNAKLKRGQRTLNTDLRITNPKRWWPAGLGEQNLYDLKVSLTIDGEVQNEKSTRVGLRTVELIQKKDKQGECFRFKVNGVETFCKGANWIPHDNFIPRISRKTYFDRVADARDANMNMLRIWGGGIYEEPAFYEACDELGLMVWQDFMFGCAEYPEDKPLLENIRREATEAVRALRNYPSLVLWCGNNENQWGMDEWWPPRPARYGEVIYDKLLPDVCKKHDPSRPYWPGSPYGGPKANDPNIGDQHVWVVWAWWQNPHAYRNNPGRFVSEFGFQAMPCMKTVKSFTRASDRKLLTPVIDHHNKAEDGHARIFKYMGHWIGAPRDLEEYVYLSQVQQMDVVKIGVEHWRRRWPDSAGALYWQLNDCWPVSSWAAVDYYGRAKGLWYASKRFYAPTLVSFRPVENVPYGPVDLEIWACNNDQPRRKVTIEASSWTLAGKRLTKRVVNTTLQANSSRHIAPLKYADLKAPSAEQTMAHVVMRDGQTILSSNTHYFAPIKYIDFPDPKITWTARADGDGFMIEFTAKRVARAVMLSVDQWEGRLSDNFFDLIPGEPHQVRWTPRGKRPDLRRFRNELAVRHMTTTQR